MIRVLQMIGGLNYGGSQAVVLNYYQHMDREKIQFDFILDKPELMDRSEEVKALGGKIFFLPKFNGKNACEVRHAWKDFFQEHPEYKILHSHVRSYASLYLPIAKRAGLKTIAHSHNSSNGNGLKASVKAVLQFPLRYQADYLMGCSGESGEWLFGKRAAHSERFFCLPNAIDLDAYAFREETRQKSRKLLGLKEDEIAFFHVGRFAAAKNHSFLLDVFSAEHQKNPKTKLVLVGGGELKEEIKGKIAALRLQDAVLLAGERGDVPDLLQAADAFLFPSNWEGLPMVLVEAQAVGLPCLIADNITEEVQVSDLIHPLPIDRGTEPWIQAIDALPFERKNVIPEIRAAGFDIPDAAKKLELFYESLIASASQ